MTTFTTDTQPEMILSTVAAETLSGDIRDALLTHVRSIKVPWTMLSEDEQQDHIAAITSTAEHAVREIALVMAKRGFQSLASRIGKWTVKDGVKIELNMAETVENITALAQHGAGAAVLVLAESGVYFGERGPAKPDKDQPDLPLDHVA